MNAPASTSTAKVEVADLAIRYGDTVALEDASFEILEHEIFGIIGPANSGKTSFLRALNRMDDFVDGMDVSGTVKLDGKDVRKWRNVYALRRRIGVVFPLPVGPMSRMLLLSSSTSSSLPRILVMLA